MESFSLLLTKKTILLRCPFFTLKCFQSKSDFFCKIENLILKYIRNAKANIVSKTVLKKNIRQINTKLFQDLLRLKPSHIGISTEK